MQYANHHGYTDVTPYEVVRVISDKTIEIREMNATLVEGWKPEFTPGGFAAHCLNNYDQSYNYFSSPESPVIRARKHKNGKWKSKFGEHILSDKPLKFYDYNF